MGRFGVQGFVLAGLAFGATFCEEPSTQADAFGIAAGEATEDAAEAIGPVPGPDVVDAPEALEAGVDLTPDPCAYCDEPYPACVTIDGQALCVQCTEDSHCGPSCWCNLDEFACAQVGGTGLCGGDPPPAHCLVDQDCATPDRAYPCDTETGWCYDPQGSCDWVQTNCNWLEGSSCQPAFGPRPGVGIPGLPGNGTAYCACEPPLVADALKACVEAGSCPDEGCFAGQVCVQLQLLCLFGDCPPLPEDGGMCASVATLEVLFP